jgi:hypothetical protein
MSDIHLSSMRSAQPSIVFMHVTLPHPPLVLDSNCVEHRDPWRLALGTAQRSVDDLRRVTEFGAQVECVGDLVANQIGNSLSEDPDASVLILGDHGTKALPPPTVRQSELTTSQTWERLAIFTAFGGPPRCDDVLVQASTVDTMREMVRCLLGAVVVETRFDSYLVSSEIGRWETPVRVYGDDAIWSQ